MSYEQVGTKAERPYEHILVSLLANLPLQGGHRELLERYWKEIDKQYDEQIIRERKESAKAELEYQLLMWKNIKNFAWNSNMFGKDSKLIQNFEVQINRIEKKLEELERELV